MENDVNPTPDSWVKCQSKSRPGKFYLFNKFTGETKWLKTDQGNNDPKLEEINNRRNDEDLPNIMPKFSKTKTPAQDRLKRLQNHLFKQAKEKQQQQRDLKCRSPFSRPCGENSNRANNVEGNINNEKEDDAGDTNSRKVLVDDTFSCYKRNQTIKVENGEGKSSGQELPSSSGNIQSTSTIPIKVSSPDNRNNKGNEGKAGPNMAERAWKMPESPRKYSFRTSTIAAGSTSPSRNEIRKSNRKSTPPRELPNSNNNNQSKKLKGTPSNSKKLRQKASPQKSSSPHRTNNLKISPKSKQQKTPSKSTDNAFMKSLNRTYPKDPQCSKLSLSYDLNLDQTSTLSKSYHSLGTPADRHRGESTPNRRSASPKSLPREALKRSNPEHDNLSPSPLSVKRIRAEQLKHTEVNQPNPNEATPKSQGFVSRLKQFYKTATKAFEKPMRALKPSQDSIETPRNINEIMIQNALHEMKQRQQNPADVACLIYKGAAEHPQAGSTDDTSSSCDEYGSISTTPKSLNIPCYDKGSANSRLQRLRNSFLQQPSTSAAAFRAYTPTASISSEAASSTKQATDVDSITSQMFEDDEPMDWEPSVLQPDNSEISTSDTSSIIVESSVLQAKPPLQCSQQPRESSEATAGDYYDNVNENLLRFEADKFKMPGSTPTPKWLPNYYYFVLDTNVMLKNLAFVDDLSKMRLCDTLGTILFIPYAVLQELDKLKMRHSNDSIKTLAVRAIKYLNSNFEKKNLHIQAQSALEERKHLIDVLSLDDSIINCCLQLKQHIPHMVFLSEDVNLRNKAICNNIFVSTKSDLVSKRVDLSKNDGV